MGSFVFKMKGVGGCELGVDGEWGPVPAICFCTPPRSRAEEADARAG